MRYLTAKIILMCVALMFSAAETWALPACPSDTRVRWTNCFGTYTTEKGTKYAGEWKDNNWSGQGTSTSKTIFYNGSFLAGSASGIGRVTLLEELCIDGMCYPKGTKYSGEFKNDFVHGEGVALFPDGTMLEGIFEKNIFKYPQKTKFSKQISPLETAFNNLSMAQRKLAQSKLAQTGLYKSLIDGIYGKGTEAALVSYNKQKLNGADLTKSDYVEKLIRALLATEVLTCGQNAKACTSDQLCSYSTIPLLENRAWETRGKWISHVNEAKRRGLTCGVDFNLASNWPDANICNLATRQGNGKASWDLDSSEFVTEAERRGLKCGVTEPILTATPSVVTQAAKPVSVLTCAQNAKACTSDQLCSYSTIPSLGNRVWETRGKWISHVNEAKGRGLTCGIDFNLASNWPDANICNLATRQGNGKASWDLGSLEFVTEAKRRGLTCGVAEEPILATTPAVPAATPTKTAEASTCDADPKMCPVPDLCQKAVSFATGSPMWTTDAKYSAHIGYAKSIGISCGTPAAVATNTQAAKPAEVPKPTAIQQYPNRKALVIGNSNYANANSLKNPTNDAKAIASKLTQIGFDVTLKLDLGGLEMIKTLSAFKLSLTATDISLFYFAGHGVEIDKQNYLIPTDASMSDTEVAKYEAVPLERILSAGSQARELSMVLIDACRDNPFAATLSKTRSGGRGLAIVERVEGPVDTIISFAATSGDVAEDGDGINSPYAEALLEVIDEPNLDIGIMFRKLRDRVIFKTKGKQTPETVQQLTGDAIYLVSE